MVRIVLSGSINYAITMGYAQRNAFRAVKAPPIPKVEIVPPSVATVLEMLEIAEKAGHPLSPAIHLEAFTGVLRGEPFTLLWHSLGMTLTWITVSWR